jgi:PEP-CTERM motif
MTRVRAVSATVLVMSSLLLLPVGPAAAIPSIVFDQTLPLIAGSVSWAGGAAPLVGTDIVFKTVTGVETPANAGSTLSCVGDCFLNFVTGSYAGGGVWNPGGSFILTGDLGGIADSGILLTGTWTSPVIRSGGMSLSIFNGEGSDTKDPALLAYFGYPADFPFNFANTEIAAIGPVTGPFSVVVSNADISNIASPIPEPGTLLLLGSGISALALRRRRKS